MVKVEPEKSGVGDSRVTNFLELVLGTGQDAKVLDEGIRDVVLFLVRCGFNTMSSCHGGKGHPFKLPTVIIEDESQVTTDKIAGTLVGGGYQGFTIKYCQYFQNSPVAWKYCKSHFTVEFWRKE